MQTAVFERRNKSVSTFWYDSYFRNMTKIGECCLLFFEFFAIFFTYLILHKLLNLLWLTCLWFPERNFYLALCVLVNSFCARKLVSIKFCAIIVQMFFNFASSFSRFSSTFLNDLNCSHFEVNFVAKVKAVLRLRIFFGFDFFFTHKKVRLICPAFFGLWFLAQLVLSFHELKSVFSWLV